jgi:hypothetical protein
MRGRNFGSFMNLKYLISTSILLFILASVVNAQNKSRQKVLDCTQFKYSEFYLNEDKLRNNDVIDIGNGFSASRDCNSLIVKVPGKYLDTLSGGPSATISIQIAAFVYLNVCKSNNKNIDEVFEQSFIKTNKRKLGSGMVVDEYLFKTKNNKIAHIFTYLNEYSGLLSILEIY